MDISQEEQTMPLEGKNQGATYAETSHYTYALRVLDGLADRPKHVGAAIALSLIQTLETDPRHCPAAASFLKSLEQIRQRVLDELRDSDAT